MIAFPFSRKSRVELSLAIDIESGGISAGLFESSGNGKPKFLYTAKESFPFEKELTAEGLFFAMSKNLDMVLLHCEKYGLAHLNLSGNKKYFVGRVAVSLSSPWHISEIKSLSIEKEKPFVVSENHVRNLVEVEEKEFESRFDGNSAGSESRLALLERKIITSYLNGYQTLTPFGKKASKLEIILFTSICERKIMNKIKSTVAKHFPNYEPVFHSFTIMAFAGLRDLFPKIDDFIFVQVGGEVTDIAIVNGVKIAEVVSFPLGHNVLVRRLDLVCKNSPGCELATLLKLYHEDKVRHKHQSQIKFALADAKLKWTEAFNNAISIFSEETFLPKNIFLSCQNQYGALFENFLKTLDSSRFTLTSEPFAVIFIGHEMAESLFQHERGAVAEVGVPLVLLADFMLRLGK